MGTKEKKGRYYKFIGLTDVEALGKREPDIYERSDQQELQKLEIGNAVQLFFQIKSNDRHAPRSERLWVIITSIGELGFKGKLHKHPTLIQNLSAGDTIEFQEKHILKTMPSAGEVSIFQPFFEGCVTTIDILHGRARIGRMYREEAVDSEDSGWMILSGSESKEYFDDEKNFMVIALGHVISVDHSIAELLDAPVGTEYYRSKKGKRFVKSQYVA